VQVCANHPVTADLKLVEKQNATNAWCWGALDFAEDANEGILEKFCAKFKTPEIAAMFQQAVDKVFSESLLLLFVNSCLKNCNHGFQR